MYSFHKVLRLGLFPCGSILIGLFALFALRPCSAATAQQAPNVLLITIDTLRADHLGCYGYEKIRTPNIDRLAAEGVRFEKAYTLVPVTLPSHTVMFTGSYPMRTGMHDFRGNRLGANHRTLAAVLRDRGYTTAGVIGSPVLDSRFGLNRGFGSYDDRIGLDRPDETILALTERRGDVVIDKGLAWLEDNHQKLFFLWIHLFDPHYPYDPPSPYAAQYKERPYDGEIAFVDLQVGRVLEFLKEKNVYDRTLVILAGDHGEGLGDHGEKTHGLLIYSSTLRVPLIFKLPADQELQNKVVSTPVTLVNLMPTVLEAVGLPVPRGLQGKSVLPLVRKQQASSSEGLYAETLLPRNHFNWSELRSIWVGNYRFIEAPKPELYDLSTDPGELHNLFYEKQSVARDLQGQLEKLIEKYSPPPGQETAEQTGLDPVLMEQLKSLGYVAVSGGGSPTNNNTANLIDPKDRIQMYNLVEEAVIESQKGRYDSSNVKLRATFEFEKNSPPVHYLLAVNYYRQGDYSGAIKGFRKAVTLKPDYGLATYYLGLTYARTRNLEQAVTWLKKALRLDPANFSAAFNLGAVYLQQGRARDSLARFRQTVAINPGFAPGHRALGELLLHQDKVNLAIGALRKAVALAPSDAKARHSLAKALRAKETKERKKF